MRDWRWPSAVPAHAHGGAWLRSLRHRSGPLKIAKKARDMSGGGIILCCEGPVGSISRAWSDSGSGEMSCSREIIDRKLAAAAHWPFTAPFGCQLRPRASKGPCIALDAGWGMARAESKSSEKIIMLVLAGARFRGQICRPGCLRADHTLLQ